MSATKGTEAAQSPKSPTSEALRTVEALSKHFHDHGIGATDLEFAKIIDKSTQLPQILEALEEINAIAWDDEIFEVKYLQDRLRKIARQTDALLAAHKPRQ